jgi:prephenate dehydrogenase
MSAEKTVGTGIRSLAVSFVHTLTEMVQQVAVIGAGGKMGSWFVKYFSRKSDTRILAYDKKIFWKPSKRVTLCATVNSCVREADLVVVCVPITTAPTVIKECASSMKSGAILAEISSIKSKTFLTLKKYSKKILPLCIHPMFGPGTSRIRDTKVLLIPVRNKKTESATVTSLLRGSEIIVLPTAQVHDKYMAIILGLTYFANLTFAKLLSKEDILFLQKISGIFFRIQLLLMQGILNDEPSLVVPIISRNAYTKKYISEYLAEADTLGSIILERKDNELLRDLLKVKLIFGQSGDLQMSYQKIYAMFKKQNEPR